MAVNRPTRELRDLVDPVVLMAFSGWNDAASAATSCLDHIAETLGAERFFTIDSEDYYDFQVNRPVIRRDSPTSAVHEWPETTVSVASILGRDGEVARDLVLITGPEPNLRWRSFTQLVVSALRSAQPSLVIMLGALLSDCPHTRPVPVSGSSIDPRLLDEMSELDLPDYEGPTGIVGLLSEASSEAGLPTVNLWASVPHYVAHPPNPKATLALLAKVEDVIDLPLDPGELTELAKAWERGVDELAAEDSEIAEYVSQLEESQDEQGIPEASGDAIAAEFQRYLRRRD
ncbi:PAC2 family protein [Naumannella halotolerans]|uniref:Proteasome assembly chaperone (PAC2) family protein n=1 Tax=Naumannella halotolerans TaxID=993414 RepID=A0A4R7J7L9_9ACTN|nr:PAC2 family protein [Naumannella halotolerans]TDT33450.1 proteasome assembly chaperone (PAC2) family protein [Naumannella halotolerans]